jgi:RNA polymerase sigma-70 factor (ECF subfamily)
VTKALDSRNRGLLADWSQQYGRAVRAYFQRRLPRDPHCDDLVQEVFVRLASRGDFAHVEHIEGYVFQTAANVLRNHVKRRMARDAGLDPFAEDIEDDAAYSPERVLIGKDLAERLIDTIGKMPDRTRTIFMLYHFEYMPHAQIARRLSIAVRTVEDHIARANLHLSSVLRRDE